MVDVEASADERADLDASPSSTGFKVLYLASPFSLFLLPYHLILVRLS